MITELAPRLQEVFANEFVVRVNDRVGRVSPDTASHMHRVAEATNLLGSMTDLSDGVLEDLSFAGAIHDMTKVRGLGLACVEKPDMLTLDETIFVNGHPLTAFLDINRNPQALRLPGDETEVRAPRIGFLVLMHHMYSTGENHRIYPNHLPANYLGRPIIQEFAQGDGYVITEDTLKDPELELAGNILSIADVMDAITHPAARGYMRADPRKRAPLSPEAAVGQVVNQVVIPKAVSQAALLILATHMTAAHSANSADALLEASVL